MVKLHLKNPKIDALALLHGTRPFVIELDGNKLVLAKVAKGYDIIAKSSLASIRIDSDNIKTSEAHHLIKAIVEESFTRGHQFEVTKVTKKMRDDFAWIATTSPEQLRMLEHNKILVYRELLQPTLFVGGISNRGKTRQTEMSITHSQEPQPNQEYKSDRGRLQEVHWYGVGDLSLCEHYRQYRRLGVLFFLVFSKFLLDISSSRVKRWQTRFILS